MVQNGWDHSQLQNANRGEGGYTIFLGGEAGKSLNEHEADRYLSTLNSVYGITSAEYNGQRKAFNWPSNPLAGGSYSCYKVHQWTTISGSEFQPAGNLFFAGEHCSKDFQGYMNGAAETGRRVAILISRNVGHGRASYRTIA